MNLRLISVVLLIRIAEANNVRFKRSQRDAFKVLLNLYKMNPLKKSTVYQLHLNNSFDLGKTLIHSNFYDATESNNNTNNSRENMNPLKQIKHIEDIIHKKEPIKTIDTPIFKVSQKPEIFDGITKIMNENVAFDQFLTQMNDFQQLNGKGETKLEDLIQDLSGVERQQDISKARPIHFLDTFDSDTKTLPEEQEYILYHQKLLRTDTENHFADSGNNLMGHHKFIDKETEETQELHDKAQITKTRKHTKAKIRNLKLNLTAESSDSRQLMENLSADEKTLGASGEVEAIDTELMKNQPTKTDPKPIMKKTPKSDFADLLQSVEAIEIESTTTEAIIKAPSSQVSISTPLHGNYTKKRISYENENNKIDENRDDVDEIVL